MRRRMDCASPIVFNCRQFSKPGTPWVLEEEPTAMTILSYLGDVSKLQMQVMEMRTGYKSWLCRHLRCWILLLRGVLT